MKILMPQGVGDSIWAILKAQSAARNLGDGAVDVLLNCQSDSPAELRAREFVSRFSFVRSVEMYPTPILKAGTPTDADGIPRYLDSGRSDLPGVDYVLVANGHLHRGQPLDAWLPDFDLDWNAVGEFRFRLSELEFAESLDRQFGSYIVFSMGSLHQNTVDGHNRNGIWKPADWITVGNWAIETFGVEVVLVGGTDDRSYAEQEIMPHVSEARWTNLVGRTGIGQTFALTRRAKYLLAYQSGIGIFSQYMGVPCGVFWRQKGDSFSPSIYITNENEMASAWARPEYAHRHTPLLYGRDGVERVKEAITVQMGRDA